MTHRIIIATNDTTLPCLPVGSHYFVRKVNVLEAAVAVVVISFKYVGLHSCWICAESRRKRDDDGGSSYNSR